MARLEKDVDGVVVRNILSLVIFVIGLSQMAGFVLNLRAVRAIGAATVIAPFPKVFSDVDGVETFASKFILEYTSASGEVSELEITPEVYGWVSGPYNRRNVYGAALSYGPTPKFPKQLFNAVFNRFGFNSPKLASFLIHKV